MVIDLDWSIEVSFFALKCIWAQEKKYETQAVWNSCSAAIAVEHQVTLGGMQLYKKPQTLSQFVAAF